MTKINYKDNVTPAIIELAELDRSEAVKLLSEFGVVVGRQLKEEQYEPFLRAARERIDTVKARPQEPKKIYSEPPQSRSDPMRDLFAMAALQSPLTQNWTFGPPREGGIPVEEWADRAYLIADAMLARRKT